MEDGAVPTSVPRWKRLLFSLLWLPDDRQGFVWPAFRMARSLAASAPFDVVYTSAPPFSTHLVGWLLNATTGTRWIAEFRDPWLDGVPKPWHVRSALSDAADRQLEQACLRRANDVVAVTYTAAEKIASKRAALGKSAPRIVLNGIDAGEPAARPRAERPIRAVHVGSLYHSRDPRMLLEGIASLHRAGQLPALGLRVEFVGDARWYGDLSVEGFAQSLGIGDIVSLRDSVPHAQVAQILAESDLLILLAQRQPAQVPNKLYEYLAQRKPILAFADDEGETASMLRRAGEHFVVTEMDSDKVTRILRGALGAATDPSWAPNDDQLAAWRTDRQMAALVSLLED
jgi:glycosyltransferase involved in cell wall biosynthesis